LSLDIINTVLKSSENQQENPRMIRMQKVTPQIWGKNSSMNFRTLVFTADFFEQATMIEATGCPEIRQSVLHPCASAWLLWSAMFFTMLKASESI
jgi:hypothetical protein